MFHPQFKLLTLILVYIFLIQPTYSNEIKIKITGNERVSAETIKMFGSITPDIEVNAQKTNNILKKLYESNFFEDVSISFENNILLINVKEKPIIIDINYNGVKNKELRQIISENRILKPRSSFDEVSLRKDQNKILSSLKGSGYYFAVINSKIQKLDNNKLNIIYDINLGEKSKIKRITFIGDKIFKDKKLRNIIISEEYKFWKFISGRKFLNKDIINLDMRLLKNFYLNKGYKNVEINSSFAKLINENEFELIFNIVPKNKIYFNNIDLVLPSDFKSEVFKDIYEMFEELKGQPFSLATQEIIINKIEIISLAEQFESPKILIDENITENKLDLQFLIKESEKLYVDKINIFGNNVTLESVIRNQLLLDEGDPYNEILYTKSINRIKSLNFFKETNAEIIDNENGNKTINILVEEKPTGEIALGAGAGTNGATIGFSVKENNFLGKGINLVNSIKLSEDSVKGKFNIKNPNYKNSDKSVNFGIQALEIDRLSAFGYKTNKTGFSFGTGFEYLNDLNLNINVENFYEKITTDGSASVLQKTQEGNYWDSFLELDFDYDKRNQRYDTNAGFRNFYSIKLPVISDTNTLSNSLNYKYFTELYDNNITTASLMVLTANSVSGENIKLSERLFVPGYKLRGFENGKIGPKDGNDFIGGNFVSSANITTTLPQILSNYQNLDIVLFFDAANVWGVDYSSSIDDGSAIRSSLGFAVDWSTAVGPLTFSFAQPLLKENTDVTETFRFNLGTTF